MSLNDLKSYSEKILFMADPAKLGRFSGRDQMKQNHTKSYYNGCLDTTDELNFRTNGEWPECCSSTGSPNFQLELLCQR